IVPRATGYSTDEEDSKMPRYAYSCGTCGAEFAAERSLPKSAETAPRTVCSEPADRVITPPRFLFKADPRDSRPYWHNHDGYGHSHPPRRGRHRTPEEDH